jgi:hypothetical protein
LPSLWLARSLSNSLNWVVIIIILALKLFNVAITTHVMYVQSRKQYASLIIKYQYNYCYVYLLIAGVYLLLFSVRWCINNLYENWQKFSSLAGRFLMTDWPLSISQNHPNELLLQPMNQLPELITYGPIEYFPSHW